MKIAFVYDRIYPYHRGGGEKRAWELARCLATQGHDVSIIGPQMWPGSPELLQEGVHLIGVSQSPHPSSPSQGSARGLGEIFGFIFGLWKHLLQHDYQIVECSNFPYLTCVIARLCQMHRSLLKKIHRDFSPTARGFTLIIYWHEVRGWTGWWNHRRVLGLLAAILERILPLLTRHHCANSCFTRTRMQQMLGMSPARIQVVECGVNLAGLAQFLGAPKLHQLVCVGRLVPHKRVETAIHTLARLTTVDATLRLKIIGEGPALKTLITLTATLGLSDRVDFSSGLTEEELYRCYATSKIFLFPSAMEGFGMVALEAMAAGTPVVAQRSPTSAVGSLIQDGQDGLLAETAEDWFHRTRRLLQEAPLYQSIRAVGLQTASRYDWPQIANRTGFYFSEFVAE